MEEVLGNYQSLKQARKMQDALAREGGDWLVVGHNEHSVIYGKDGQELLVSKKADRVFEVIRKGGNNAKGKR